jgi:hypothetical protein
MYLEGQLIPNTAAVYSLPVRNYRIRVEYRVLDINPYSSCSVAHCLYEFDVYIGYEWRCLYLFSVEASGRFLRDCSDCQLDS